MSTPTGQSTTAIGRGPRRAAITAAREELTHGADPECSAHTDTGYYCTRYQGHTGLHVALMGGGPDDVCEVWTERPVSSPSPGEDAEQSLREQIASEIERCIEPHAYPDTWSRGMLAAARIARGVSR